MELALEVGHDELALGQHRDAGQLYGVAVLVGDPPLEGERLCRGSERKEKKAHDGVYSECLDVHIIV